MIAAIATLTIGFFLAAAIILGVNPAISVGRTRQKTGSERGSRLRALKKLIFHFGRQVKRRKKPQMQKPPREWEKQPLNKLKVYNNYIIKKAEIAPIR